MSGASVDRQGPSRRLLPSLYRTLFLLVGPPSAAAERRRRRPRTGAAHGLHRAADMGDIAIAPVKAHRHGAVVLDETGGVNSMRVGRDGRDLPVSNFHRPARGAAAAIQRRDLDRIGAVELGRTDAGLLLRLLRLLVR